MSELQMVEVPRARVQELMRTLRIIAEEPGTGPEKAAIAWAALKPNEDRT